MAENIGPDETQYDIEDIDLPASFDFAIFDEQFQERSSSHGIPRKRPRSPSISPPPELANKPHDVKTSSLTYLDSEMYGASRFGQLGEYMRRKRQKLKMQDSDLLESMADKGSQTGIFKGISIYINGWTDPSQQELRQLILKHGGVYQPFLDQKSIVTHVITCSLTPAKVREFKRMKVVTPAWLTESIKRGVLLDWRGFIFKPGGRLDTAQGQQSTQTSLFTSMKLQNSTVVPISPLNHFPQRLDPTPPSPPPPNQLQLKEDLESTPPTPPPPNQLQLLKTAEQDSQSTVNSSDNSLVVEDLPVLQHLECDPETTLQEVIVTANQKTPEGKELVPKYAAHKSNLIAQRVMGDPDWRAAHTSMAPDFIEGYYKNSRLHHLSVWKAELRALVLEAHERAENGLAPEAESVDGAALFGSVDSLGLAAVSKAKGKQKATSHQDRVIMHCDFDSFFVTVGLLDRPELVGKPVVVCHSQGTQRDASSTSEIASASYEARKFGVKSGMSLQQARKLCPEIFTMPYEFEKYKRISLIFYTILSSYADDLQAVSVDEALIEVTNRIKVARTNIDANAGDQGNVNQALVLAEVIRTRIKAATGCTVSVGVSHNIMLARLATRRAKPDGAFHLMMPDLPGILEPLELDDLHGFGHSAKQKAVEKLGSSKLKDLMVKSKGQLCEAMGKSSGETLYNALQGIDERKLESDRPRKSVSCDINYGVRFETDEQAEAFVQQMAQEVSRRMDAIHVRGSSLTLKIMKRHPDAPKEAPKFMGHGRCETFNKQSSLSGPDGRATSHPKAIAEHAIRLLRSFSFDCEELRGLAIQIQKVNSALNAAPAQIGQARLLFKKRDDARVALTSVVDAINPHRTEPGAVLMPSVIEEPQIPHVPTEAVTFDLPSFSQVDQSIFNALPQDLQDELSTEYERRSRSRSITPAPKSILFKEPLPVAGPSRPRVQAKAVVDPKRIVRQLAPKKTVTKPVSDSWTFESKGTGFSALDITDSELRKLDIDIDFYRALPRDIRRDQLAYARHLKSGKPLPSTAPRKVLRAPKFKRPPGREPYKPPPRPKANIPQPPTIKQAIYGEDGKRKKVLLTNQEDIENAIETWVDHHRTSPPNASDIEFFAKFLLKSASVNKRDGTDGGVEKAVRVMHWWQLLLRQDWSELEGAVATECDESVGRAWWQAFQGVRDRLNEIMCKRFGGCILL